MVELDAAEWDKTIAVNSHQFWGVLSGSKTYERRRSIVNTSSMAGRDPFSRSGALQCGKAGVNMITKTLALELGPKKFE